MLLTVQNFWKNIGRKQIIRATTENKIKNLIGKKRKSTPNDFSLMMMTKETLCNFSLKKLAGAYSRGF